MRGEGVGLIGVTNVGPAGSGEPADGSQRELVGMGPRAIDRLQLVRATDRAEAESAVADSYLPNRLVLPRGAAQLDMTLVALRLGSLTVGRLGYGTDLRLVTDNARQFHINAPVVGRALSAAGRSAQLVTAPGEAAVFPPDEPAEISWTADCVQICLMVPRPQLESELEQLLGRSLTHPLRFAPVMDLSTPMGRSWWDALQMIGREFDSGPGLAAHPLAGRHLRRLLLDGLLLGQPHNYTETLSAPAPGRCRSAIAKAVEHLQDRPGEPWSSTTLAREVHVSVRALQEGFKRDVGRPPMAYLREVRLRRAHEALERAVPGSTTVEAVALQGGWLHMGRFAAAYREAFGEPPSTTLRRE
jgi:AraC-like DNA-binding protein